MPEEVLSWCLKCHRGVAIGEDHTDARARYWVRSIVPLAYRLGVRWLFDEGFKVDDPRCAKLEDRAKRYPVSDRTGREVVRDLAIFAKALTSWTKDGTHIAKTDVHLAAIDAGIKVRGIEDPARLARTQDAVRSHSHALFDQLAISRNHQWMRYIDGVVARGEKFLIFCGMAHTGAYSPEETDASPDLRDPGQGVDSLLRIPSIDVVSWGSVLQDARRAGGDFGFTLERHAVHESGDHGTFLAVV